MYLTRLGYYSDFFVYPLILLLLSLSSVWGDTPQQGVNWICACLLGMAGFSLLEYGMHRFAFHRFLPLCTMHERHHAHPTALIGSPTWITAPSGAVVVFLPLWWLAGLNIACGVTFGLILGYLWYGFLHHCIHHWPVKNSSYLLWAQRYHSQHHHAPTTNFGVTSPLWDYVFWTIRTR
jgi:sterol desaturase/sphingolipid hydroxylase (fatty acid hydroxylase superfamily)